MASKEDRPGLLSKVAMFVRNPTKDWSELDQPGDGEGNGYDKAALKAMIERKRQNDFVRKREFDQLRKLRDRDPGAIASLGRQSFFQNSLSTDLGGGGRADTLKKIDEIEAQMSRQWWKSKTASLPQQASSGQFQSSQTQSGPTQPPGELTASELNPSYADQSSAFAATQPMHLRGSEAGQDEFTPTQMVSVAAGLREDGSRSASPAPGEGGFSTSRLFAIEVNALDTDPELEEAAIRFANSDDSGAERTLLEALRGNAAELPLQQAWVTALLDLYRATNNPTAFDSACIEFALPLEGARPAWFALADSQEQARHAARALAAMRIWDSPAVLTAQGLESLRNAMVSLPMPWHLGWSQLEHIAADAIALLDGLFDSLCDEAVSLRFDGHAQLLRCLRALTPTGNREVPRLAWQMRLNALRAMGLREDFERADLDYCVSFEVASTAWTPARCSIALLDAAGAAALAQAGASDATALVLRGQIVGDASAAMAALYTAPAGAAQTIVISCRELVRVDFAAAGSLLNWVTLRQADGSKVQFLDVNRLVAAFFNVIGINEHARVVLRAI